MQFVTLGAHTINLAQVCGITWHQDGSATVGFSSGGSREYDAEHGKTLAEAVGKCKPEYVPFNSAPNGLKELKTTEKESSSPASCKPV